MTIEQILTDITSVLGAIGVISTVLAHLPLPAKYAQFFARLATYAANAKFSVNQRDTLPKKDDEPKLPPIFPGAAALFLLTCFASGFATSCALFSPADYAHCLPTSAGLLSDVAEILKSPDYESKLKELALTKTEAAVICAVEQFVDLLAGKVVASPDEAVSVSRGKAFLAKAGAK
jgi:hypothetical protein